MIYFRNIFFLSILLSQLFNNKAFSDDEGVGVDIDEQAPATIPLPVTIDGSGITFSWDWFGFDHIKDFSLSWGISPLISASGDKIKYLINLGKNEKSIPLDWANENDPYMVIETKGFDLSAYLSPGVSLPHGFIINGQIAPLVGSKFYSERKAKNLIEAKSLPNLGLLSSLKTIDLLREGDFVTYELQGGVNFSIGPGYLGFSSSFSFTAQGGWEVALKKGRDQLITGRLTLKKLKLISANVGLADSAFSSAVIGGGKILENSKSFSFEFDLAEPSAQKTFESFIKGKLDLFGNRSKGVRELSRDEEYTRGRFFDAQTNLPFLASVEFKQSKILVKSKNLHPKNVEGIMSLYTQSSATNGPLSRRMRKTKLFGATYLKHQNESSLTANLKWSYQRERMKGKKWQQEIDQLIDLTGLGEQFKFDLPGEVLGMVKIDFDLEIPSNGVGLLMKNIENIQDDFWDNLENVVLKNYCQKYPHGFRARHENFCKTKIHRRFKKTSNRLKISFNHLKSQLGTKNMESFLEKFSEVGELMIEDPLAFQAIFQLSGGNKVVCINLSIQGEKLAPKTITLGNCGVEKIAIQ